MRRRATGQCKNGGGALTNEGEHAKPGLRLLQPSEIAVRESMPGPNHCPVPYGVAHGPMLAGAGWDRFRTTLRPRVDARSTLLVMDLKTLEPVMLWLRQPLIPIGDNSVTLSSGDCRRILDRRVVVRQLPR